jgi:putative protease
MNTLINKPELLCPAGDLERLRAAVDFGADAVYLAGEEFGMRTAAKNFSYDDLRAGVAYAHERGVAVHVTCNTIPHNDEIARLPEHLMQLADIGVDAVIASDFGTINLVKKYAPKQQEKQGRKTTFCLVFVIYSIMYFVTLISLPSAFTRVMSASI